MLMHRNTEPREHIAGQNTYCAPITEYLNLFYRLPIMNEEVWVACQLMVFTKFFYSRPICSRNLQNISLNFRTWYSAKITI